MKEEENLVKGWAKRDNVLATHCLEAGSTNVGYLCHSQLLVEFFGRPLVLIPGQLCPFLGVVNCGLGGHPDGLLGSAENRVSRNESFLELVELCAQCLPGLAELEDYRLFDGRARAMVLLAC